MGLPLVANAVSISLFPEQLYWVCAEHPSGQSRACACGEEQVAPAEVVSSAMVLISPWYSVNAALSHRPLAETCIAAPQDVPQVTALRHGKPALLEGRREMPGLCSRVRLRRSAAASCRGCFLPSAGGCSQEHLHCRGASPGVCSVLSRPRQASPECADCRLVPGSAAEHLQPAVRWLAWDRSGSQQRVDVFG